MAKKKKIGVVLSGCGHRDGSEVHEATLTLLAIDRAGAEAVCFAPKGFQSTVCDHVTGAEAGEKRDMLLESARIARGNIRNIAEARTSDLDALVMPGGAGAASNLSTFFADGISCSVHQDICRLVREMHLAKKPMGAICIAPATLARALQEIGVHATITGGTDDTVAKQIEQMGHRHEKSPATNCVIDRANKVVTTPAYMNAASIAEVWSGIEKLVAALIEMA